MNKRSAFNRGNHHQSQDLFSYFAPNNNNHNNNNNNHSNNNNNYGNQNNAKHNNHAKYQKTAKHVTNPKPSINQNNPYMGDRPRNPKRANDTSPSSLRFESKLDAILAKMDDFTSKSTHHDKQINYLYNQNCDQETRLNDLEQSKLDNMMDITGLKLDAQSKSNPELLRSTVFKYLKSIGHTLELFEIADAFYLSGTKKSGDSYEIIRVTFLHDAIKRRVMKLKLNSHPVFFSHVLTKHNRLLLLQAKRHKKSHELHSAWTMNGQIFIKKQAESGKVRIFDARHLSSFIDNADESMELDNTTIHNISHPNISQTTSTHSNSQHIEVTNDALMKFSTPTAQASQNVTQSEHVASKIFNDTTRDFIQNLKTPKTTTNNVATSNSPLSDPDA